MTTPVIMPDLGAAESVSTLVRWLVAEGEHVKQGQPLFVAESDKSTIEIEASQDGTLVRILAQPGESILAGEAVALLGEQGEPVLEPAEKRTQLADREREPGAEPAQIARKPAGRPIASPLARRLAEQEHVDLSAVHGTGPGGRILRADVVEALEAGRAPGSTRAQPAIPLAGTRGVIARRMAEAAHTTAPVTLTCEAEATALCTVRAGLRKRLGEGASYDLLLALVAAQCLAGHPDLNASLGPDGVVRHALIHIGVAVDTPRGLVVPVLRDVPGRALAELAADLQALIQGARDGSLPREAMSGGTFTVTNLGLYRIDAFTPIINLPECAILGMGQIRPAPVVRGDGLAIGKTVALSLTFDHRLVDGAPAARFLTAIAEHIEQPGLFLAR